MNLQVHVDASEAKRLLSELGQATPRIAAMALNRTATKGRTFWRREIAKDAGLKAGTINKQIAIEKATSRKPIAALIATGKRIPLIDFGARGPEPSRGRGRGVSYRGEGGVRKRISDAFITTLDSGHRGVFKRSTPTPLRRSRKAHRGWLPIKELFGPSVAGVAKNKAAAAAAHMERELVVELETALRFVQGGGASLAGEG